MSDPQLLDALRGSAPPALVQDGALVLGSWEGIPGKANLIDVRRPYHYPLPRFLSSTRIKEWQAIQAQDADTFIFAVLYDAKYLGMASIDIWDKRGKKKAGFRHNFPGRRFSLPASLEKTETAFRSGSSELSISIDLQAGRMRLLASSRPRKTSDSSFEADLSFDLSKEESSAFSVCLPLGLHRAMYSTKILMPCSGRLVMEGETRRFEKETALGILDDHKGYYPYRLHYDWVTGFGVEDSGRRVGFNLTDNQVKDQQRYNENRLWIGSAIHTLPPIRITRPYGRAEPWIIQDTEGMVDLIFHPEVPHDISMSLGLADIDYAGPFGRFEGSLRSSSGEKINVSKLYGMGEDKNLRL
ncbi:MAG: DUF2804 domain-containing protein [Spirochaetia bacterium]|nr:DUF2804 domain-containing protein [Spirochaetia bacterium]